MFISNDIWLRGNRGNVRYRYTLNPDTLKHGDFWHDGVSLYIKLEYDYEGCSYEILERFKSDLIICPTCNKSVWYNKQKQKFFCPSCDV